MINTPLTPSGIVVGITAWGDTSAECEARSLEIIGTLHRQRIWMDFSTGVVKRIQVTGGRLDALLVYQRADDGTVSGFDFSAAQDNVTGSVRYRNAVLNGGIESERFVLTIPPGASIERLR